VVLMLASLLGDIFIPPFKMYLSTEEVAVAVL
jgi:hypothetical protein